MTPLQYPSSDCRGPRVETLGDLGRWDRRQCYPDPTQWTVVPSLCQPVSPGDSVSTRVPSRRERVSRTPTRTPHLDPASEPWDPTLYPHRRRSPWVGHRTGGPGGVIPVVQGHGTLLRHTLRWSPVQGSQVGCNPTDSSDYETYRPGPRTLGKDLRGEPVPTLGPFPSESGGDSRPRYLPRTVLQWGRGLWSDPGRSRVSGTESDVSPHRPRRVG